MDHPTLTSDHVRTNPIIISERHAHHSHLLQSAHMRLPVMCLKTEWLFYIHFLFHCTIQEGSLDIHLVYLPFHYCSQSKYRSDGSVSGYSCKILFIIYPLFLGEATSHKYWFIFLYATICNMLDHVDPLGSHNKLPLWSWYNIPKIILHDWLIFFDYRISALLF